MAMETSPQSPAPVRQIANAIAGWVDRLGAVWVEGQVAQVSRRPGLNTVFMTLRDPVADISVPVTCSRTLFDGLNPPLVEGASVVVHAKPSYYANRGTLSLYAREIRMVGLGELLARLERRRQLLAAEGLFAAELKRRLPFLPGCVGLVTARQLGRRARRARERPAPLAGGRVRGAYAAMQGQRAAAEVIEALDRLDRNPDVDVIVVARGGGSVEDLLPFSDEALIRAVAAVRTPVVSAIGHEPDQPLLDLVADVRASTPTDAAKLVVPDVVEELRPVAAGPRPGPRRRSRGWLAREQAGLDALRSRPALADPRTPARRPLRRGRPAARPGPALPWATPSTGPPTTSATSAPGPAPSRRWRPCSAATPSSRTPTATWSTSVAGVDRGRRGQRPGRRRPHPRHHHPRPNPLDQAEPDRPGGRR